MTETDEERLKRPVACGEVLRHFLDGPGRSWLIGADDHDCLVAKHANGAAVVLAAPGFE